MSADYPAPREQLLGLYRQPRDARFPAVCFDERPCFLIGEAAAAQALQRGKVARRQYASVKLGSCGLLAALEPRTGKRVAHIFAQRRKREYAWFLPTLAEAYPKAETIRLVQDNLNTHSASAC